MRVHDVEPIVLEAQFIRVTDGERHVDLGGRSGRRRQLDGRSGTIEANHVAGPNDAGQVDRDRARSTTDVEHIEPRAQLRQKIRRRVLSGPPTM